MKTVTFYHSMICPRCRMAGLALASLLPRYPDIRIEKVEFLTNRARARDQDVRAIPTLVADGRSLSGFYLTKRRIREFLESL